MLVKSDSLPTGIQTDEEAMKLFREIEVILLQRANSPAPNLPWMLTFTSEVNRLLDDEDGDYFLNSKSLEIILSKGGLGPGSSAGLSSPVKSDKLRYPTSYSPSLRDFIGSIKGPAWLAENLHSKQVDHVDVISVPKTAFIDRTVSAVPVANMYLQMGLGELLREKLARDGIDVRDQTRNQNLAKRALSLKLATIDLSSASSWFSEKNLVGILPEDLLHLLDLIRPKTWRDECDVGASAPIRELMNWLPMGCGYTFNLMTLYFWALVRCTVPRGSLRFCSVYGDDIIVPQAYAELLVDRLEALGFKVNKAKSYLNGNFFESCGHEYFSGQYVTPFYCRRGKTGSASGTVVPVEYRVQLANRLRLWAKIPDGGCDSKVFPLWKALVKRVPPRSKPCVPALLGDVGLITTLEESKLLPDTKCRDSGWEYDYYKITYLNCPPVTRVTEDAFSCLLWLMNAQARSELCYLPWVKKFIYRQDGSLRVLLKEAESPPFSRGEEPVKGLFGLPRLKRVLMPWLNEGLFWRSAE